MVEQQTRSVDVRTAALDQQRRSRSARAPTASSSVTEPAPRHDSRMERSSRMSALEQRLTDAGFALNRHSVADRDVLVARRSEFRWAWVANRLHVFVVAFEAPDFTFDEARALSESAHRYAIEHKGGLPRGLQTGSAALPTFVVAEADDETRRWFCQEPRQRFAAMNVPVLLEASNGRVTHYRGDWRWGYIYAAYVRTIIDNVLTPPAP